MSGERVLEIFPKFKEAVEGTRMLDAWRLAESCGVPLADWPEGDPLRQVARMAAGLGANRLSRVLHWTNWRKRRDDPARFYQALYSRAGVAPLVKLMGEIERFIEARPEMPVADLADLLAFRGWAFGAQRDYAKGGKLFARALELAPADSWLRAEHSSFLSASDRYEEALEEAREAVRLSPCYRPAVLRCSDALIHLGRDDEALALLLETHEKAQHAAFPIALQLIFSEREDHGKSLWCMDEIERLSPLADPPLLKWIASRRADFLLASGDTDAFLEQAAKAGEGFQKSAAEHFRERGRDGIRKRLNVSFVRQHRSTCAPATLAALAAYWGSHHEMTAIADAICYEGTPWHKERNWAENHGFVTREFRFTRESLKALIDRGIPFTLTTQWTTGAHLQACIGYDFRTDVVLLRDPTERHFGEMLISGLLKNHPLAGPRGMVMVPADRANLLENLTLEDEHVYDSLNHLRLMMDTHDRFKIEAAVVQLRTVAPGHLLALEGELRAAQALEEWPRALRAVDELLERLPHYESLALTKCQILTQLRRASAYRAFLEKIVVNPKADPVFLSDLGELLLEDARELTMADYYLRRSLMKHGGESRLYANLARCRMKERRFGEAVELQRAASCLSPSFEPYAANYFETSRLVGGTGEALEYLESRAEKFGGKDHGPWITLAQAYVSMNRATEAAVVLEKAALQRKDDGYLLLHGGRLMVLWGPDFRERGLELMRRSRGQVPETLWLGESAEVASFMGDRATAIREWRSLLVLQPTRISVWRYLARAIAEEEGRPAALQFIEEGTRQFPDFADLWALAAEWLARTPAEAMVALENFLKLSPKSIWGFRERALRWIDRNDCERALADANEAYDLDPLDPASLHIRGVILEKLNRREEAALDFRKAISLAVDETDAPDELLALAVDRKSALEALAFIDAEMRLQVSNGAIVPRFQHLAWRWIEPPELLKKLQHFCEERPDLWQTWSARTDQALRMQLHDEAMKSALTMTRSFPLMARAWLTLARVHEAHGDAAETVAATTRALELAPSWDEAERQHAEALERANRPLEAEAVMRKAIFNDPLNAANHGWLTDLVRRSGRREEASQLIREALKRCPFYNWGWSALARWSLADGRRDEAIADLESTTREQGHHRAWWPIAANVWEELGEPKKAIAAIERGIELSPDDDDLRDHLAALLANDGQFESALEACKARPGETAPPRNLEGRHAWLLMRFGQPVRAIEEMRALLDRESDYVWGLSELTGWLSQRGDWQGVLEIATRWARQAPRESRAFGYIGQAEENLNHPFPAENAYARALMLQPDHRFAGRRLLDLQMKAERFDEAAETLRRLHYYAPSIWVDCDGIELALLRKDHAEALNLAGRMLDRNDADFEVLNWVHKLFQDHWAGSHLIQLIDARLKAGNVAAPGALAVSIGQINTKHFGRRAYKQVKRQPEGSPLRIAGWRRMIDLAGKLKAAADLAKWARKDRAELSGNPVLWREMGSAFLTEADYVHGVDWFKGWREREADLDPDTLVWIAALNDGHPKQQSENWQTAKLARQEALRRFPASNSASAFRAALAFQEAVDGEIETARELLNQFEPDLTADYYQRYAELANAIVAAADGDEIRAKKELTAGVNFFSQYPSGSPVYLVRRSLKAVAERLPWTRNSSRKLRRAWKLKASAKPGLFQNPLPANRLWPVGITVVVVINLCRTCSEQLPARKQESVPLVPYESPQYYQPSEFQKKVAPKDSLPDTKLPGYPNPLEFK